MHLLNLVLLGQLLFLWYNFLAYTNNIVLGHFLLNISIYYDIKGHLCDCLSQFQVYQVVKIEYLSLS